MISKNMRDALVALDKVRDLVLSGEVASFSVNMAGHDGIIFVYLCDLKTEFPEEPEDAVREEEAPVQEGVSAAAEEG